VYITRRYIMCEEIATTQHKIQKPPVIVERKSVAQPPRLDSKSRTIPT